MFGGTRAKRGEHKAFDAAVQQAQREVTEGSVRIRKLAAGGGLYLWVAPDRRRAWRYRYRVSVGGWWVERTLTLGTYPDIGLDRARTEAAGALDVVRQALDPVVRRRVRRAENTSAELTLFRDLADA